MKKTMKYILTLAASLMAPLLKLPTVATATVVLGSAYGASAADIPTLDEMAGNWMPMKNVDNPPAVHNFNDLVLFYRDKGVVDLTSFTTGNPVEPCNPGGLLWCDNPNKIYPTIRLLIDGTSYPAIECRWYPNRALRRNHDCAGLSVETDLRMINEQYGVLCQVRVTNSAVTPRKTTLTLEVPGGLQPDGKVVLTPFINSNNNPGHKVSYVTATCVAQKSDAVSVSNGVIHWNWTVILPPGGTRVLEFVAGHAPENQTAQTAARVSDWAGKFAAEFDGCKKSWERRCSDAFTPGNKHFSANLPVLATDNAALNRNYYMGVVTMLILEWTQFAIHPRSFVTSGERRPGTRWIPLTVGAMWRLGFRKDAFEFYCRTAEVTKEGPFAQAHEVYGPNRADYAAPVRVAYRDGCLKECISGVAFADVVINTFFSMFQCHYLRMPIAVVGVLAGIAESNARAADASTTLPAIVLTSPLDYQVFQREDRSKGTATIAGRLPIDAKARFRWRGKSITGEVPEQWNELPVTAGTHAFSLKVTVPAGGWYRLELQAYSGSIVLAQTQVAHVGMGEVFVVSGQSNSTNLRRREISAGNRSGRLFRRPHLGLGQGSAGRLRRFAVAAASFRLSAMPWQRNITFPSVSRAPAKALPAFANGCLKACA